jgi:ribosomal protein L29
MATKKNNLKGIAMDDLKKKLATLQENLRVIKFKVQGAKSKNVKESMTIRKEIARILTEINRTKVSQSVKGKKK